MPMLMGITKPLVANKYFIVSKLQAAPPALHKYPLHPLNPLPTFFLKLDVNGYHYLGVEQRRKRKLVPEPKFQLSA